MAYTQSAFNAQAKTIAISATSVASASVALPDKGSALRIYNEGPNVAFISVGVGAQTATLPGATANATSTPVAVGDSTFSILVQDNMQISAICRASQTATLSVQVGEGV